MQCAALAALFLTACAAKAPPTPAYVADDLSSWESFDATTRAYKISWAFEQADAAIVVGVIGDEFRGSFWTVFSVSDPSAASPSQGTLIVGDMGPTGPDISTRRVELCPTVTPQLAALTSLNIELTEDKQRRKAKLTIILTPEYVVVTPRGALHFEADKAPEAAARVAALLDAADVCMRDAD